MRERLQKALDMAESNYISMIVADTPNWRDDFGIKVRLNQVRVFKDIILNNFTFQEVNLVETGVSSEMGYGMFGYFLASFVNEYGGLMTSVDLNGVSCEKSEKIFKENFPNLNYRAYCSDSVEYLKKLDFVPNLVHLDSYDFDILNPFPSAHHHWKEFMVLENMLPNDSIVLVDDNWTKGTYINWVFGDGSYVVVDVNYPLTGKGAIIYNEVLSENTKFEIIGREYLRPGENVKVYIKKCHL